MKNYLFRYEDASVYASAFRLLAPCLQSNKLHIDIGCGEGAIAEKVKASGASYIGFDINENAISRLKEKGFEAQRIDLANPIEAINIIINSVGDRSICSLSMLDVIEHIPYDNLFLHELSQWLRLHNPDARLVTSIPNFSHADISIRLMAGRWDYTESGLLDRTHNDILTECSIHNRLESSGWKSLQENHYELTISDQRFVNPKIYAANSESGIGQQLRGIKSILDPNHQVHQFINLWAPQDSLPLASPSHSITNFILQAKFEVYQDAQPLTAGIQVINIQSPIDLKKSLESAAGEYVVFTKGVDILKHPIVEAIKSILDKNERPIIAIEEQPRRESEGYQDLEISPGPWLAVPTPIIKHYFKCKDMNEVNWQNFIVMAMVFCGVRLFPDTRLKERVDEGIFSPSPTRLTLREIFNRGELDSAIATLWPNCDQLRDWLCLPERLKIERLQDERIEIEKFTEHLSADIAILTETCKRLRRDLDEILADRDRIQSELNNKNQQPPLTG